MSALAVSQGHPLDVPPAVETVFARFYTCELTTLGKTGRPISWPIMPLYWRERGQFVAFTSIGLPQKAFNVRLNPRVALLFSDATGSGLADPPTVLVQGDATVDQRLVTSFDDLGPELRALLEAQALQLLERQPSMKLYLRNGLTRRLMDWYFMRLLITVTPRRVRWWPTELDITQASQLEVPHVA